MAALRFLISISVNGALIVAGLIVAAFGIMQLSQPTMIFARAAEAGDGPPLSFLLMFYGQKGVIIFAGLAMLFIGGRGLLRRVKAGLPSDDDGVGVSPASRAFQSLIYGVGFAFGLYSLTISIVPTFQMALLVMRGVTVQGTIITMQPGTDEDEGGTLRYQFRTLDGRWIVDSAPYTGSPGRRVINSPVSVTYLPLNPEEHDLTGQFNVASLILFFLGRLLITIVGLWGLVKNLAPRRPLDASIVEESPLQKPAAATTAPTVVMPSGTPTRRTTFGRRGI